MGIGRLNAVLAVGAFACVCASIVEICEGNRVPEKFIVGGQNFAPLEDGLLKFTPVASGPVAMAPDHKFPLILAAKRTRRPDVLNKLRIYVGGWDITNKHYWAELDSYIGVVCMLPCIYLKLVYRSAVGKPTDRRCATTPTCTFNFSTENELHYYPSYMYLYSKSPQIYWAFSLFDLGFLNPLKAHPLQLLEQALYSSQDNICSVTNLVLPWESSINSLP